MDGARETSRPSAAMKTVRSSLPQLSRSSSPESLGPRLWSADPAAAAHGRRREYEFQSVLLGWGGEGDRQVQSSS